MGELRVCETDSYFEGSACPDCGASGRPLLSAARRRQVSTFLSGALRHFPADVGLSLDEAGWADWETVVERAHNRYEWLAPEAIAAIVYCDPKGRFERDGGRLRAAYGHSVEVSLSSASGPVPETLYHGTSPEAVESIMAEGLKPMARQHVHLSGSRTAAREVGRRHASEPVVLEVEADALQAEGHEITKRGTRVYTTDHVPPAFLCGLP